MMVPCLNYLETFPSFRPKHGCSGLRTWALNDSRCSGLRTLALNDSNPLRNAKRGKERGGTDFAMWIFFWWFSRKIARREDYKENILKLAKALI